MSKTTPGPWKAVSANAAAEIGCMEIAEVANMRVVPESGGWPTPGDPVNDARLIAAAPTLLAALQTLMKVHDEPAGFAGKYGRKLDELVEAQRVKVGHATALARAAISHATGGQA